jgi:3-hydroxyisobutyrate dehydrogenase-like beta-hydroxyacid dehydrogenase
MKKILILHPGQMGISIAAAAQTSDSAVYWLSEGRSDQTRQRAAEHNLQEGRTLPQTAPNMDLIISVCPPHAAETVAQQVAETGFKGLYLDANAISPARARRINQVMTAVQASYVDGGIIGGPAWEPNRTWLYLSGPDAQQVADCFAGGPLGVEIIGSEPDKASALKMCFAAYTKGTTALLAAILATAETLDVRHDLERQWSRNGSDFAAQTAERVRRVTAKAWRFAGEMDEIADTFQTAGLPGGFHQASADIYQRLAHFKGAEETPELTAVLQSLHKSP